MEIHEKTHPGSLRKTRCLFSPRYFQGRPYGWIGQHQLNEELVGFETPILGFLVDLCVANSASTPNTLGSRNADVEGCARWLRLFVFV